MHHLGDILRQGEVARDRLETILQILIIHRLRLCDQGIDHIHLPSPGDLLLEKSPYPQPCGIGVMHRADRPATRRQLVDHRDVEIAVERHGERSRNGRGGHHQHVGRLLVLGPHPRPLLDAETVLLVDDDQPQIREAHPILDQRMSPHQQLHLARSDPLECSAAFAGLRCTREDRHPHRESVEQARKRGMMLPRQNLGGRHHAGLKTVIDGQQHRQQCHERLARPHVALQQAVHLVARHRILPDFAHDALLRPRQREGQHLFVKRIEHCPYAGEVEAVVLGQTFRTARHHIELHAEQLLELEAVLRLP